MRRSPRRRPAAPRSLLLAVLVTLAVAGTGGAAVTWVAGAAGAPAGGSGPGPAATASPSAGGPGYALWATGPADAPVRWDPCGPVRWVLNPAGMPAGARADLDEAFDRIAAATGLTFRFAGTTSERPGRDRPAFQPERYGDRWAPVLVAWGAPEGLPPGPADRAAAIPVAVAGSDGPVFVTGQLVVTRDADLAAGFGDRVDARGALLLHELGHLVGLDHVGDPGQMMYPFPVHGETRLGAGDRAGLRAVSARGCLGVPDPRPVEVSYGRSDG